MKRVGLYRAFLCLALVALSVADVYGQDAGNVVLGALRGTVEAESSGKPIEGALVTADRDGHQTFAKSDVNGEFVMELAPGVYDIKLSHPQFADRTYPAVEIRAGKESRADITMFRQAAASSGSKGPGGNVEEIVVTGRYEQRAIDQSRFSESVLDVLSSKDFAVTADSDVTGALSRVTGITVVDDKFVYVRGLGERYASTLFNSAQLPSPDPARRVVPLDLFPSGVMKQLTIQKTWAPYLPGDFSGGSLQMTTRDIPGHSETHLGLATEYNTQTTGKRAFWYKGDSQDWTGFEGGFRSLPKAITDASVNGHLPLPSQLPDDTLRAIGLSMDRTYQTGVITLPPNFTLDYSHGNSVESRIGNFGYLVGLRYKNGWQFKREARRTSKFQFVGGDVGSIPAIANDFLQTQTSNAIGYSALGTGEWAISDSQVLKGTVFYTRLTEKRFLRNIGFIDYEGRSVADTTWEWEERQLWSGQLVGDHTFPDFAQLHVDWGVTYSEATRNKPDSRFYEYEDEDSNGLYQFANESAGNARQWEDLTDQAWDLYWNDELPITILDDWLATLKFGVKYFDKTRDSNLRRFRFANRFPTSQYGDIARQRPENVFADQNIGRGKFQLEETTQFTDSYDAAEKILGLYLQADNELWENWRLLVGFRYEDSMQETETRAATGGLPVVSQLNDTFLLPAVGLTWQFRRDMQARVAFSQTINRPDLREISPAPYLDPEDRDVYVGNPNLQIAQINNYDFRWEWYYGGLDSLELAGFYKEFSSPIEETLLLRGNDVLRTYQNADSATLYGVELSMRQGLEVLGNWSRDFYYKFNGALMDSNVNVAKSAINQTNQSRRLQGQSNWVVNFQLTYDNLIRNSQATLAFNMFGDRIADVGVSGFDDAYEQPVPRLDLILKQGFKVFGTSFSLRLRANNLLDPAYERQRAGIVERRYRKGRSIELKLEKDF
jgi:outer membrane receptor protein involved in Fe transport